MHEIENMTALYVDNIRDLYSAENQLVRSLPRLADAATEMHLKETLARHVQETRIRVTRLETICRDLGVSPNGHFCKGMEGLVRESDELIRCVTDPLVLDAGIIGNTQKIDHYEISGYGTAREFARLLGYGYHADLLDESLLEESSLDTKLTQIAETYVNVSALHAETST